MKVVIKEVSKQFGDTPTLRNISLEIADQELFFLLGPSGCGKTTLLRTIAGFYPPDKGEVRFGDRLMNDVPPHQRNTGMVFQNYALWPHMSVEQNVSYGLEVRDVSAADLKRRVGEALEIVRMQQYARRTPNQLSGGQQQRVALARALVIKPDVLLLDEPLSNLDAQLRLEMREEIRRIHAETRITMVYVTHDQKEALSLADRLAVMRAGRIEQLGDPRTVYRTPVNPFVAEFIGETNWVPGTTKGVGEGMVVAETELGMIQGAPNLRISEGVAAQVGFRPEAVRFGAGPVNSWPAVVEQASYLGEIEQYHLRLTPTLVVKAFEQNAETIRKVGQAVEVHVRPQDVFVLAGAVEPAPGSKKRA